MKNESWLKKKSVESGLMDGYKYYIVPAPSENALNGYIVFPKPPTREQGYDGVLAYVPVHGGITYAENVNGEGMVYGFDTLHYNSHEYPRHDCGWVKQQIKIMLDGILMAAKVEDKYNRCVTNKGKAKWLQMIQDIQPEHSRNFKVSLNLLSGQL